MQVLVDAAWLAEHLDEVVVCDVRWYLDGRSGQAAYDSGHIPGAVFVDLDTDLAAPPGGVRGRHPLPEPADFAAAMGRLGIADGTPIVAYDDTGGSTAARLVWMLRALGEPAAILDGGLKAWTGALSTEPATPTPASFTPRAWDERLVTADELVAGPAAVVLLDARAAERYRGEIEPIDPRAGHVPGARSLPWMSLLDPETGRLLPPEVLRERFESVGAGPETTIAAYCGSGVNACFDLLAAEVAGFGQALLFPASWSGWSNDPERPAATGAEPGEPDR